MSRQVLGIAILVAAVLAVIVVFVAVGRKVSRSVSKNAPDSPFAVSMTPSGVVLMLCLVSSWVAGMAARELTPESSLGQLLNRPMGLIAGWAISVTAFAVAAALLGWFGSPISRRKRCDI